MKLCNRCRQLKSRSDFHKDKTRPDGLYTLCKACKNLARKEYSRRNKQKILTYAKHYREQHLEDIKEYQKKYMPGYYQQHKQAALERTKNWRQNNPEQLAAQRLKHYAKRTRKIVDRDITKDDWLYIMRSTNWCCSYCGVKLTKKTRTIDHVIPLARGGTNNMENLVPACLSCNCSKQDKVVPILVNKLTGKANDL